MIDVNNKETIVRGLCMPHSPRWHNERLWICNSGCGELLILDLQTGKTTTVCRLPAYVRGLCHVGQHAVMGMSQIRERHIFGNLPIQQQNVRLVSGVAVVDLRAGKMVGLLEFTSGCREVFDVQFLPGIKRPMIVNLDKPEARQAFTTPDFSYWLRGKVSKEGTDVQNAPESLEK